ncbi:Holliday junction resolvase RuvX [Candidatus Seribacter sulfatis]|jgi:putative Holliday junction resolvase|uniref:Holliday junction resolvase RuvX n=1 Tax=Candidatus Seribacter sulfatis TaxID=3381756 RepID=UPI0038999267
MPVYLGIDYGTKRIGLAWADELGIALPIGAVPGVDDQSYLDRIADLIEAKEVNELIVGYPIHMDGTVGVRAKEVDVFIATLEKSFAMPVHRVDERLTSLAAEESLGVQSNKKKKKNLGKIDASAAGIILRDFIENRNVIPPPQD